MRGQRGRLRALAGKCHVHESVIFRRVELFVLAEVFLPRRPHAVLPRSQVLSEKRKWRRTWKAVVLFRDSLLPRPENGPGPHAGKALACSE